MTGERPVIDPSAQRKRVKRDDLFDNIVYGIHHDLFLDPLGRSLGRIAQLEVADAQIAGMIRHRVERHQARKALGQVSPFRTPQLTHRQLILDVGPDGETLGIRRDFLNAHVIVGANTGAGKSNLLDFWAIQLAPFLRSLWLVDTYKQERRFLLPLFERMNRPLIVLSERDAIVNILQTDFCDPRHGLNLAIDLLVGVLELPDRARRLLYQFSYELFEEFGIFEGRRNWPTLFHLYEKVRNARHINVPAQEATLDRLGALLTSLTPRCAAYTVAWSPIDLANYHIVFEGTGASEWVRALHMNHRLNAVFQHAIERGETNQGLKQLIFLDDAQRLLSKAGDDKQHHASPMEEFLQVIRGSGRGVCLFIQSPANISSNVRANTATKVMGRLGTAEDWRCLGRDMAMTPEQIDWARRHLRPGLFICTLAEGSWREPFLMRIPRLTIPHSVTDEDVKRSQLPLRSSKTQFASEFADWRPRPSIRVQQSSGARAPKTQSTQSQADSSHHQQRAHSDAELRILAAIASNPGLPSSRYAKLAHMSPKRFAALRAVLVRDGLLREHEIATGSRGRNAIVLELLPPAIEALKQ